MDHGQSGRLLPGNRPLSDYLIGRRVVDDPAVARRGPLVGYYPFNRGARTMVHRDGYAYSVAMYTADRTTSHEDGGENLRGAHTSDGWLQILDNDFTQFDPAWYATVNWARLPGTTVVSGNVGQPGEMRFKNASDFAGGVKLGADGVTGFELSPASPEVVGFVYARKGWFTFSDETVCLGSEILAGHPEQTQPLETVVEQRKLNAEGDNALVVNGQEMPIQLRWSQTLKDVRWAAAAGNVPGTDRGYFFPVPATLRATRENQSGTYADIRSGGDETPITRPFLNLWFDHGANPQNANYAYVLLPGKTASQTEQYVAQPAVRILANLPTVQAVEKASTGETGFLFWTTQTQKIQRDGHDLLSCNAPAAIMLKQSDTSLELALCDPTQQNQGTVTIEIFQGTAGVTSKDEGVTMLSTQPTIKLAVNVAGANGAAHRVRFSR